MPDAAPDGIIYVVRNRNLYAVSPDGVERWPYTPGGGGSDGVLDATSSGWL
jgi:hypothetical protein